MNFRTLYEPRTREESDSLETIAGNWEDAIFICTKCASKIRGEISNNGRTRLKAEIKDSLRSEGIKGVRVLEVSCLDVCERNKIAIATSFKSPIGKEILLVSPGFSGKKLLQNLLGNKTKF